ncbi:MAG: AraC family transcriptional regulator [Eubacteriales bacterium]|nr:AraC family transcriptional regulator [Eubacteriales bacterium]
MKAFHEVRNYPSDFMVWHERYRNISFIAHWHREIELIYVRSGTAQIHVTDASFNAQAGDLIVCDSGDIHFCDAHSEDSCFDFLLFDTAILSSHYQYSALEGRLFSRALLEDAALLPEWERLLGVLDAELAGRGAHYQEVVKSELRSFWYRLLRLSPSQSAVSVMQNRRRDMLADLQNLLTFLEDHCGDPISLTDAAEMMGFSPSHFSRLFKQLTGTGFVRYLNIIRISQAAEQLVTTDDRITDIALRCGFGNVRSFNRVFLEITGYTPSEYIKRPESRSYNFTYYRSSADLISLPEENPTIKRDFPLTGEVTASRL